MIKWIIFISKCFKIIVKSKKYPNQLESVSTHILSKKNPFPYFKDHIKLIDNFSNIVPTGNKLTREIFPAQADPIAKILFVQKLFHLCIPQSFESFFSYQASIGDPILDLTSF